MGDTLYLGSEEDVREDLAYLSISSLERGSVSFVFVDLLQASSSHTLIAEEEFPLDIDRDGLDEYVLIFAGAEGIQVEFSFKRVAQISFALFGAPVVIPVVLRTWLIITTALLCLLVLAILIWWARKIF